MGNLQAAPSAQLSSLGHAASASHLGSSLPAASPPHSMLHNGSCINLGLLQQQQAPVPVQSCALQPSVLIPALSNVIAPMQQQQQQQQVLLSTQQSVLSAQAATPPQDSISRQSAGSMQHSMSSQMNVTSSPPHKHTSPRPPMLPLCALAAHQMSVDSQNLCVLIESVMAISNIYILTVVGLAEE